MTQLTNFLVNAAVLSAIYALIAIGLSLIYGVGGIFNLAHGVSVTLGAYVMFYVVTLLGWNVLVGVVAALLVPGLFSLALYKGLIKTIEDRPTTVMTVTLLIELIAGNVVREVAGSQARVVPLVVSGRTEFLGTTVLYNGIVAFVVSWVVICLLFLFVRHTMTGQAILATSMSRKGTRMVGIDRDRANTYTWVLAGVLAGIGGLFFGSIRTAQPSLGLDALLIAFPVVVLGGIGSIRGSVIAAYIIGLSNVFVLTFVSSRLAGIAPLVIFIVILLVRPKGIFGREVEV